MLAANNYYDDDAMLMRLRGCQPGVMMYINLVYVSHDEVSVLGGVRVQ